MDNTDKLVFRFREHLAVLNRSPSTIKSYIDHLKSFLNSLKIDDVRLVTRTMIEEYIAGLYDYKTKEGRRYGNGTICIKVRSIKRFFEYLEHAGIIFIDPASCIREPNKERGLIKQVLTHEEITALFDQPDLSKRIGVRDRAIIELFYSTGIRNEELCSLTIYDADLMGKMIRINKGKGQKDRVVPMGRHAAGYLKSYITKVRPHYTRKDRTIKNLFVDNHGKPINKQAVYVMVKKYGKAAGIQKPVSPHLLRHCFATDLIKNGADIVSVQRMLGHADLSTTQIYIRSLGLDIKRVHKQTHPREKDHVAQKSIRPDIERIMPHHE